MSTMVMSIEDARNDAVVGIIDVVLYLGSAIKKTDYFLTGNDQITAAASVFKIDSV